MRLVLLGPPGAGKGSLAELLRDEAGLVHIATGDILRAEIQAETDLGKEVKKYIDNGDLVPDELVIKLIENKITTDPNIAKGYMLDGFPRTLAQAEELDKILTKIDQPIQAVVYLDTEVDLIIWRLAGRRICRDCGAVYHITNRPPKVEGVCNVCKSTDLYQRADDNEETVRNRLDVYLENTLPIVDYYETKNVLMKVDGKADSEDLCEQVIKSFNEDR